MPVPTPYIPSIALDAVMDALGAFIQPFIGASTPIVRAYDNDVATPPLPYAELIELLQIDLETPRECYDTENLQLDLTSPKRIDIQLNVVGPSAAEQCSAIKGVFRSTYAASQFPAGIAPLYCDDGRCNPMVTAEQQYDYRWTLTCSLQYNPVVVLPQQSADTLAIANLEALK